MKTLDTGELGPIKVDTSERTMRARVVKEALEMLAEHEPDPMVQRSLTIVARAASQDTLLRLARLLKA